MMNTSQGFNELSMLTLFRFIDRYGSYGLAIDIRHKMLLADCMTYANGWRSLMM